MRSFGTPLIVVGLAVVLAGILAKYGLLGWVGRLPGDIRIEGKNTRVFVPITTSIVLSVVLSVVVALFRR